MATCTSKRTIVSLVLIVLGIADARSSREYSQWIQGDFQIPLEIGKTDTIFQLRTFLENQDTFTRMAAVRQVGMIQQPGKVELLLNILDKEPATIGIHSAPLVRMEVVRSLGRIRTAPAKAALLGKLNSLWRVGPTVPDKKHYYRDRDFVFVVPLILETLSLWSEDPEVFQAAQLIAESDDVRNFYNHRYSVGEKAWMTYLACQMRRSGIADEKDSALYLLDFLERVLEKPIEIRTLDAVKRFASESLLKQHSDVVVSAIVRDLDRELANVPRNADGSFSTRFHKLTARRGYLTTLLEQRSRQRRAQADAQPSPRSTP